jgi:hypothetical protein
LPGRSAPVYKHVFNLLDAAAERLNLKFEPDHIMSDYEKALIKAVAAHVNSTSSIGLILLYLFSFSFQLRNIQAVTFIIHNV